MAEQPLMSNKELSEYLQIPEGTLYNWRLAGLGPKAAKCGRHLRYRRADVERWLDAQAAKGTA